MNNPLETLKEHLDSLPRSQKLVVDYIIGHYTEVGFMTVDQLATRVGTSTTTVMRLMANVGYSGYSDFQKKLQVLLREQSAPQTRLEENLKNHLHSESWKRHYELQLDQIHLATQHNTESNLNEAIELICQASAVYCTSVRSGLPVAQYVTHNLNRMIGHTKLTLADSSDWIDDVISFTEKDLLIAVSFARYGERIIEYVNQAKKKGAKIVALTDKLSSPLAPFADVVIICPADSLASHNSIISAIYVSDYLISALSAKKSESLSERLKQVDGIFKDMQYHVYNKRD